jgi:hypothetical protein
MFLSTNAEWWNFGLGRHFKDCFSHFDEDTDVAGDLVLVHGHSIFH